MSRRVDIVIPVYNERENFLATYRVLKEVVKSDWRAIVVYDMPDDTTLREAGPISKQDAQLSLVRNRSRGVLNAIKTGFVEARAEAVLVLMVDDPPEVIQRIDDMVASFYEQEATIVVASRYMQGAAHEGGSMLKSLLSGLAGLSLHRLIRLPVHDATYATRLYRRAFLDKTPIESTQGFEFTLELTLKAYLLGEKIIEIPVLWRERTVGQSRFKLLRWIPAYAGWYFWGIRRYWFARRSVRPSV